MFKIIESNTGIIKTDQKLFFEQNEYFAFEICARDSNGNSGKTTRKACSGCMGHILLELILKISFFNNPFQNYKSKTGEEFFTNDKIDIIC